MTGLVVSRYSPLAGATRRTSSSTAAGTNERSAAMRRHSSPPRSPSSSATAPPRSGAVVTWPAMTSCIRLPTASASSSGVSGRSPSAMDAATRLNASSPGAARRSRSRRATTAASSAPASAEAICSGSVCRCEPSRTRLSISEYVRTASSSSNPHSRPIAAWVSGIAYAVISSARPPPSRTAAARATARSRSAGSIAATRSGRSAAASGARIRACASPSDCTTSGSCGRPLATTASASSATGRTTGRARADEYVSGSRSTVVRSSWRVTTHDSSKGSRRRGSRPVPAHRRGRGPVDAPRVGRR
ncbi:hypothetical protein ACFQZ3_50925 [Thermocatellispora tengchongensis]|uniref:hypothetical protein n=1 Tax=Thermocatellispora tengchongensis TaxID=1073253 RepID=UPI003632964D